MLRLIYFLYFLIILLDMFHIYGQLFSGIIEYISVPGVLMDRIINVPCTHYVVTSKIILFVCKFLVA